MWTDFDIEMNRVKPGVHLEQHGRGGDIIRNVDIEAINNSLKNILGTLQGTRRMLPEFALGLYRLLFEPIDDVTADLIRNKIISAINRWDDRIEITGLDVDPREDDNMYNVRLVYFIRNKMISSKPQELTYILKRLN